MEEGIIMKIQFYPSSKQVSASIPPPRPASEYIPDWYKEKEMYHGGVPNVSLSDGLNATVKACVPFNDSLRAGYIQETWGDLWLRMDDVHGLMYHYSATPEMVSARGELSIPVDSSFYQNEFVWKAPWIPRTPKGYSIIYTHPFNHVELPFVTATGIVDSDSFYHSGFGNLPFFIREGFLGIIPAGTPMYQMIPVKRDDWESNIEPWSEEESAARMRQLTSMFLNRYRRQFHHKKRYQ